MYGTSNAAGPGHFGAHFDHPHNMFTRCATPLLLAANILCTANVNLIDMYI